MLGYWAGSKVNRLYPDLYYMSKRITYDPDTGEFQRDGKPTGCRRPDGYIVLWVNGRGKRAHRLAWEMCNGPIPKGLVIDHINRNPMDNRLANLRLASRAENALNTGKCRDYVYVYKRKDSYRIKLWTPEGQKHMGTFRTLDEAEQHAEIVRLERKNANV